MLLANGQVLLLPDASNDLPDCRLYDPVTGAYALAPELSSLPIVAANSFDGGAVLPERWVVLCPYECRNLGGVGS